MARFKITIQDYVEYDITAETEDEAINKACDFWINRNPDIFLEEVDDDASD